MITVPYEDSNWRHQAPMPRPYDETPANPELERALAALPDAQADVVRMHVMELLSYRTIAELMGIPVNTVKSHVRRGLKALRSGATPLTHIGRGIDTGVKGMA